MASGEYFVPETTSWWPIVGSVGLTTAVVGFSMALNGADTGNFITLLGVAITVIMMFGWFGLVVKESEAGLYNRQVDWSFRWGMGWFIFSEVMFFAAFFGALFYARVFSLPWLSGDEVLTWELLWPTFDGLWPSNGPNELGGDFEIMSPWGLPALNTAILLASGATLTWAHHAIRENHRQQAIIGLALTVILGFVFVFYQAEEYIHAYNDLNLTMESGIYGSTFYLLTGFHGFHVTMGAVMLLVILIRLMRGHFTADNHFGFEGVAWYWHFVDVVWLGLFIFVYWL